MSAVLRASSPAFDVDAFLAGCAWKPSRVFRRGDAAQSRPKRGRTVSESTGFNLAVSEAGFDDFAGQVRDAAAFLRSNRATVEKLVKQVGSGNVVLDFGIRLRDTFTRCDTLPPDLLKAAGDCGIAVRISRYPISDEPSEV